MVSLVGVASSVVRANWGVAVVDRRVVLVSLVVVSLAKVVMVGGKWVGWEVGVFREEADWVVVTTPLMGLTLPVPLSVQRD